MTYRVLTALTAAELEAAVNAAIRDGYRPLGPPFAKGASLCQALTRR